MEKKRSVGVTLLGIIFILLGLPSLLIALLAGISGYYGKGLKLLIDIFMRIIFIGTPGALIFSGIGLLSLKKWGRICAIITAIAISLVLCGYGIAGFIVKSSSIDKSCISWDISFTRFCFFSALFFLLVIFYLTRPKVKEQFK